MKQRNSGQATLHARQCCRVGQLCGVGTRFLVTAWQKPRVAAASLALHNDVLAVGTHSICLLTYPAGVSLRSFGQIQIGLRAEGMRFTANGCFLVVAEHTNRRVLVFTVGGEFVRHIGAGVLADGFKDIELDGNVDIIVADCNNHRVCVFPFDGSAMKTWGTYGTADGQFNMPAALALVGGRLYVLDKTRVQVFE